MNFWAEAVERDPTAVTMCLMSDALRLCDAGQLAMRRQGLVRVLGGIGDQILCHRTVSHERARSQWQRTFVNEVEIPPDRIKDDY
jgi:hypothetical protein